MEDSSLQENKSIRFMLKPSKEGSVYRGELVEVFIYHGDSVQIEDELYEFEIGKLMGAMRSIFNSEQTMKLVMKIDELFN